MNEKKYAPDGGSVSAVILSDGLAKQVEQAKAGGLNRRRLRALDRQLFQAIRTGAAPVVPVPTMVPVEGSVPQPQARPLPAPAPTPPPTPAPAPAPVRQAVASPPPPPAAVVPRMPERHLTVCRMVAGMLGDDPAEPAVIARVHSWLRGPLAAIQAATGGTCRKKRSSAPVMLACVGRILAGDRDYALKVWKAFVTIDTKNLPTCAGSLLNQLDRSEIDSRGKPWDYAARAQVMFDPAKADLRRIRIRDQGVVLEDLRRVLAREDERFRACSQRAA